MIFYLVAKVKELDISYLQFFEIAHMWKFQRAVIPQDDYTQFLLHNVVPKYVVEFLQHIQEKEITCTRSNVRNVVNQSLQEASSDSPQPSAPERLPSLNPAG